MKSLYDENHRYTDDARMLDDRAHAAITALFAEYVARGYGPREISHIVQAAVGDVEREAVISAGLAPR